MNNKTNKDYLLKLIKEKEINGLSFSRIAELTGYSISQVKKIKRLIEEKDIDSLTKHAGIGNNNHTPKDLEIQYIVEFKKQYPVISISQFQDYYQELVIWNKAKQDDVIKYGLKKRSYSFFQALYKKFNRTSPCKRKIRSKRSSHSLREPMPKKVCL